jgi:uncharacterized protein YneF (UPF0154 family)
METVEGKPSGKLPGASEVQCRFVLIGLILLLLGGCADRGGRRYIGLDSYDKEDFTSFREYMVEDEFADHPELIERTVYHLYFDIGDPPSEIQAQARIRYTNRSGEFPCSSIPISLPAGFP